jgi:hypothetical protein
MTVLVPTSSINCPSSIVGPQVQDGVVYPGGGSQIDVLEYDRNNPFVEFVGDETPIK